MTGKSAWDDLEDLWDELQKSAEDPRSVSWRPFWRSLDDWACGNGIIRGSLAMAEWNRLQVAAWALKALEFDVRDAAQLIKAKLNGACLLVYGSEGKEIFVSDFGEMIPKPPLRQLWAAIEKLTSLSQPVQRQTNDPTLQEQIDHLETALIKLSLQGRSSSAVADAAKKGSYYVDLDLCLQDLVRETSVDYLDFEPIVNISEDKFLDQFVKHFTSKAADLCLVDTHLSAPPGMTKKPDAIIVHKEVQRHKAAVSIVGVVELKKENQLNTALGQVIKDMTELADIQPKRTKFFGIYGNKTSVVFLKMVKNVGKPPYSFYQSPVMSWSGGSIYAWQMLATHPTRLGFIPPVVLKLGKNGMVTENCHKGLKGLHVTVYKLLDPLYDNRCIVAPCHIEDYAHSTAKRSKENPLEVVIKYSTDSKSDAEIATEIASLAKFQAANKHVSVHESQPLLFPIPILLGHNDTPSEKYPYLLTYPLGKPLSFDKSSFEDFAKELNLGLVLAHSKAKLFHGDVSPKNIVMHCNKPVLIDWAYSIQKGQTLMGFIGTMTFASIGVTRLRDQIQDYEYRARDDFESLFYTLLYLALENHLPWLNKKDLSATELADAKRLAMTNNWNETKLGMKDTIPFLDAMHDKLFHDEMEDVESLFGDTGTELSKRMAKIK